MSTEEKIRLNKFIAQAGVCSRRDADQLIAAGKVTINGIIADPGYKVSPEDTVLIEGKPIKNRDKTVVLAYNKPIGVTCTEKDRFADKKITDMIKYPVRVTYAGRLDKDSEGLILLTNDGDLIDKLMRGSKFHEKEYIVKVNREISADFIEKMSNGIYIEELDIKTRPCSLEKLGKYTFRIILTQGVNRQIRRMCKALGYTVTSLKRIRVANIELANLKTGDYREITGIELQTLYNNINK